MDDLGPSMDDVVVTQDDDHEPSLKAWSSRSMAGFVALGMGLAYAEFILGLLTGDNAVDAIWPHAVRSLSWTMTFRSSTEGLLVALLAAAGATAWARRRCAEALDGSNAQAVLSVGIGAVLGFISLHFIMDVFYLRGAFLLLPTAMGAVLACLVVLKGGAPRWRSSVSETWSFKRTGHLLGVFLAAWLVVPGVPALIGLAPSPPDAPIIGYGAPPGPYDTVDWATPYEMPASVVAVQGDLEDDVTFSVHLTLPLIPESKGVETVPLAILLHGFFYPDHDAYTAWIHHLAARGVAVAFLQYPSDIRPPGLEAHVATETGGQSDFLQHPYRNTAIRAAVERMDQVLLSEQRAAWVNDTLGNITVDPDHLWVGGHSLGGAYTFLTLDESLQRGWGSQSLVVALEAPADRPMQNELQPNLTGLPEHTLVQIGVAEDDMSVGVCPGAHHQRTFEGVEAERNQLLEYRSDKYGFPRLVASHYLQTDPAHDRLSDWGFYRRIDAQADFLVAHARNDTFTAGWAMDYLTEPVTLTEMGEWSDGTAVIPLGWYTNALDNHSRFNDCR